MRQLIGNTILFLLAVMERERKLTPEIEMDAFYDTENYEKTYGLVFSTRVEVTELVFFNPDDYSFIKEFISKREEIK